MQSNDSLFIDTSFIIYFIFHIWVNWIFEGGKKTTNLLLSDLEGQGIVVPAVGPENVS